jgi:hypothetical protein
MSEEPRRSTKTQIALAVAQGAAVAIWARTTEVPLRTAFRRAKEPDVRKAVESYRRRTIDLAVGPMTKDSTQAVDTIIRISKGWLPFAAASGEPWRWWEIVRLKPDLLLAAVSGEPWRWWEIVRLKPDLLLAAVPGEPWRWWEIVRLKPDLLRAFPSARLRESTNMSRLLAHVIQLVDRGRLGGGGVGARERAAGGNWRSKPLEIVNGRRGCDAAGEDGL